MNRATPIRACGKRYATADEAERSKAAQRDGARVEKCSGPQDCGGFHVRQGKTAADTGPSDKVRQLVLRRDGHACVCCGRSVIGQPYSLQHRQRRSQGGANSPSNLVTVLGTGTTGCHARIDSRTDRYDEHNGYTVRSWQNPALVPVLIVSEHGSGQLKWLTEDGGYADKAPGVSAA